MSELTDFMRLFRGRNDAYGTGQGGWIKKPPSSEVYLDHIEGRGTGLGIAPLLDDGTVWFSAIDLDEPDFAAAKDMQAALNFGFTWIESSRSGNAHVWAFFSEPIEAWIPRGIMREILHGMGKPNVEIFPKQSTLLPGMYGNYLNLAYHGKERPMLDADKPLAKQTFLENALRSLNNPDLWIKRAHWLGLDKPEHKETDTQFGTGKELHKCAEWIVANRDENPVSEGHRNCVYFNLAKMFTHYEGFDHDEAWELLCKVRDSANEKGVDSVPDRELQRILSNAERGGFTSTGCDDPLMAPYVHPDCGIAKGI